MTKTITLEQLIAFCDQLSGLVKAGVPLGPALKGLADELPADMQELTRRVGERLDAGQSIEEVFSGSQLKSPPLFQAVIRIGLTTGRLSTALEGLATTARRTLSLQKAISSALAYPLMVLALVGLLAYFVLGPMTLLIRSTSDLQLFTTSPRLEATLSYAEAFARWIVFVPPLAIVLALFWRWQSGSSMQLRSNWVSRFAQRLPGIGQLLRASRMAIFSETLALLLEQSAPLDQSLLLSAQATGDPNLVRWAKKTSQSIRAGNVAISRDVRPITHSMNRALSPLLTWLLFSGAKQDEIVRGLRLAADAYRNKAEAVGQFMRHHLPVLLSLGIGGTTVTAYTFCVMVPWFTLMIDIGSSIGEF